MDCPLKKKEPFVCGFPKKVSIIDTLIVISIYILGIKGGSQKEAREFLKSKVHLYFMILMQSRPKTLSYTKRYLIFLN